MKTTLGTHFTKKEPRIDHPLAPQFPAAPLKKARKIADFAADTPPDIFIAFSFCRQCRMSYTSITGEGCFRI
jgi:hypothetical protein